MKLYVWSFFVLLFSNIVSSQNSKDQLNTFLDQWHNDVANSDFDEYFNKMSTEAIYIGTDALENWSVSEFKKFTRPFFDKKKTWDFKTLKRNVYQSQNNNFAWFDELLDTWMGICRGSGVLEKEKGEWKIKHYVLSVTIPNEDINEIIIVKKNNETKQLNQLKNN